MSISRLHPSFNIFRLLPVFLLLALLGSACSGSKGLAKKGSELDEAGLYADAANFYFNALVRNSNNVDARIGLASTSRKVLNDKLDEFSRLRAMDEHHKAFAAYEDAMDYKARIARFGISHDVASHYADDFAYSKSVVLNDLYQKGSDLMAERRFDEAKATFLQVAKIDPNYKDVSELKGIARNEPLYVSATQQFDEGRYRQAYYGFDQIYSNDPDYKDVKVLREECLNLGKYPIAVSPFDNASGVNDVEKRVYAFFVTALSEIDDPFIRIIERENMDMILEEQRLSLSGIVNPNTASQVGNLLGAKALITATVLSYSTNSGRVRRTERDGFESYSVKLFNAETQRNYYETRYKPVQYSEYYQNNEARISVQYKAISLESGELLFSRIVEKVVNDEMYYAAYDGEVNNLIPAGPQGEIGSNRDRQRLQSLIRAPRNIKPVEELTSRAFVAAADELSNDVKSMMKSL